MMDVKGSLAYVTVIRYLHFLDLTFFAIIPVPRVLQVLRQEKHSTRKYTNTTPLMSSETQFLHP